MAKLTGVMNIALRSKLQEDGMLCFFMIYMCITRRVNNNIYSSIQSSEKESMQDLLKSIVNHFLKCKINNVIKIIRRILKIYISIH